MDGMDIIRMINPLAKGKSPNLFKYRYKNGTKCSEKEIKRILKLSIPPNWKEVYISNSELSHLQVIGKDDKQRRQYIYHPMWIFLSNSTKYERMGKFSNKISKFENKLRENLKNYTPQSTDQNYIITIMFRILKKTHIRVGNDCYARDNKTYGLCSLEKRHIKLNKNNINLSFVGKKGIKHNINFYDTYCYNYLKQRLANIKNKDRVFIINPLVLNNYLQSIIGSDFTCKDFRTYASNMLFLKILCKYEIPKNTKESKKNLKNTYDKVASKLGHTRNISKKSYVMSVIPEQYILNPKQFSCCSPQNLFRKFTN